MRHYKESRIRGGEASEKIQKRRGPQMGSLPNKVTSPLHSYYHRAKTFEVICGWRGLQTQGLSDMNSVVASLSRGLRDPREGRKYGQ